MKKKLSILGLVLILIFSLAGCGKDTTVSFDQTTLEATASAITGAFSAMSDEELLELQKLSDFEMSYTMMANQLPIEADDFKGMIDAWLAGEKDCGTILEIGAYEMEVANKKATLTAPVICQDRDGEILFSFDEDSNLKSITINANYSTGEILKKAGLNTILGMGTVFVVLIFISFIISLFKLIPSIQEKFSKKPEAKKEEAPKAAPAPVAAAPVNLTDDAQLVAAIAAAIAAYEGTTTDGFIVRSIKRRKSNKWN